MTNLPSEVGSPVDVLLINATVVTMDGKGTVLPSGAIAVAGNQIVAVGSVREVVASGHPFIRNFFQGERGRRALELWKERIETANAAAVEPVAQEENA